MEHGRSRRGGARRARSFFREARLFVAGRDKTKLVEGLARQREVVRRALAETLPAMPVHACFCFLSPDKQTDSNGLPVRRSPQIDEFPLFHPHRLSKRLNMPGALSTNSCREVAELLATTSPRA